MDRDEVDETHDVAPIVFVFKGLIDQVLHDDLQNDIGYDWKSQKQHVLKLVYEDKSSDCQSHGQAKNDKAESDF